MVGRFVNYRTEIQKDNHHFAFADTTKDAIRICDELNELGQIIQDCEDGVANWFIENWHKLDAEQKQSAHLELGIDIDYGDFE